MESATGQGLKALRDIIIYCQNTDPIVNSNRKLSSVSGVNSQSIGRMVKAWEAPAAQRFSQETLYGIAPFLWIPGSDTRDAISGEPSSRLKFIGEELRGIVEGNARLCSEVEMIAILSGEPLKGISPFTAAIEQKRRERRHSYRELCEACLLPAVDVNRIRRLLAFNGWAADSSTIAPDLIALSRYLADVRPSQSVDEQRSNAHAALEKLVELHKQSVHRKELNGAAK